MADEVRAAGSRSRTWMWMALSLVCVAGFLTWLGLTSEPSSVAIVEETDEGAGETGDFVLVPKDTLAEDKGRFEGQIIRVPSMEATGPLGPSVFWAELGTRSNQVPILVRMDTALVAEGMAVASGSHYSVTGLVHRMTDSVATAWGETGVLADEGARMQATFADFFIEASNIRPARPAADDSRGAAAPAGQSEPQG